MIEYIRRDNAIDAIENADPEIIEEWEDETLLGYTIDQIRFELDRVPAETDVVRVVRCKDCIHYRENNGRDMCAKNAVMLDGREVGLRATGKDEFCSCKIVRPLRRTEGGAEQWLNTLSDQL